MAKMTLDEKIAGFGKALRIDQNALDEELERQVLSFYEVSRMLALYTSRRDAAKQMLQTVEAEVDSRLRRKMSKTDKRSTEKELDALRRTDAEVRKANDALLELNAITGQLAVLKEAFQQRSYVLKDLVALFVANYYASSSAGAKADVREIDARVARQAMAKERRKGND